MHIHSKVVARCLSSVYGTNLATLFSTSITTISKTRNLLFHLGFYLKFKKSGSGAGIFNPFVLKLFTHLGKGSENVLTKFGEGALSCGDDTAETVW